MGDVIVVTGPPGAGKSAVARQLSKWFDASALVLGDAFFGFLDSGAIDPWREEAHQQNTAVIEAAAAASGRLADYCAVVYDGVVGPWFLPAFLVATGRPYLHYAVLLPPLEVCLHRIEARRGHGFTDLSAAEHMWNDFHAAKISPGHVIDDHGLEPGGIARALAGRIDTGAIRYP